MAKPWLRLLVVGLKWPPETFLYRLLVGLAREGVEVTVATAKKPVVKDGVQIRCLPAPAWERPTLLRLLQLFKGWTWGMVRSPSDLRRLGQALSDGSSLVSPGAHPASRKQRLRLWYRLLPFVGRRWDVIYFPWNSAAIEQWPLFCWGCHTVVSCRGSQINIAPHNPKRYAIREGLRITFKRASAVHCVSEAIKQEAMQYGLEPSKAWVIRPAVDPNFFQPSSAGHSNNSNSFRVVTTGSLIWHKGYEYALQAVAYLVKDGVPVEFAIIGDGPERQRILYTVDDLGLWTHVRLLGRLPPTEVRDQLQKADVFLLSSLSEGISNAVLEAMACGVPVVTTDCGGMREAVTDGVEGFVVPVRQPKAMAAALMRLWRDPHLRRQMGQVARRRILAEFTLDRHIDAWIDLLRTVSGTAVDFKVKACADTAMGQRRGTTHD